MFAAAAMSLSSFSVVMNALRLNFVGSALKNQVPTSRDTDCDDKCKAVVATAENEKGNVRNMKKTMMIEGMMCENCVRHVKKALEAVGGVESVEVDLGNKQAVVALSGDVGDDILKRAVEDEGYSVTGITAAN